VAERSKVWVWGRSLAGNVGSNSAGGIDICLLWVLRVVRQRCLRRADHSSWGVLPCVVCLIECDHEASIMRRPWTNWSVATVLKKYLIRWINHEVPRCSFFSGPLLLPAAQSQISWKANQVWSEGKNISTYL